MHRFLRVLALLAALLAVACGGEKKASSDGAGGPVPDTLVIAFSSSPTNLDVRVGNDNASGRMFDMIDSGLVRITPDSGYAPDVRSAGKRRTTSRSSFTSTLTRSSTMARR